MTFKELMRLDPAELKALHEQMALRGNMTGAYGVSLVMDYGHKRVRVVKGRKVPRGTEGECFWIGSTCHSPYGDPWGIYTTYRCGIKDDSGNVWWTALDNVEVCEEVAQ